MLTLIIPMISLLLLPPMFTHSTLSITISLMLMTFIPTTLLYTQQTIAMSSNIMFTDLMSTTLIILTLWISALMLIASTPLFSTPASPQHFMTLVITLALALIAAFSASNLMMFYILFEASLIPTLLLIIGWGYQPERLQAGTYLILYTVTASLPLLLGLMITNNHTGQLLMISQMSPPSLPTTTLTLWWLAMIAAFLVKMPMFLTHLWLPKAHVEAPVAGSMILAGLLLKLGAYGLLRLSFLFPKMNIPFLPLIMSISLWGAVLCSLICLRQPDLKSLIAYSSVGHMGLLTAGVMTGTQWGLQGALTMMIAHGLCSSALFAIANNTYESTSSRSLFLTKGLLNVFPAISLWWFLLISTNMAAPPSINLLSEILLLTSIISSSQITLMALGPISFLAAAYSLHLFTATQHGQPSTMFNPLLNYPRTIMISALHFIPLLLIIMKPDTIVSWV
uniref:NADH-ubiquinone oxidoreductase chain 4 n=1 Tax=Cryptonome barbada TaxID=2204078 RepID=A0A343YV57_9ANNE|nr:NADH dehydrogenase subunit 4 [Cryptonome barbada]AWN55978.1 NADH dehydrogenase subunit 4 [Cryptonome barbada]